MDPFLDGCICRPYLCSLSKKSKQVCPVLKAQASDSPKHRLATPSGICRMYKGAQQDPTGRRGLPPGSGMQAGGRVPRAEVGPGKGEQPFPDGVE